MGPSSAAPLASMVLDEDFEFGSVERIDTWYGVLIYLRTRLEMCRLHPRAGRAHGGSPTFCSISLFSRELHEGNSALAALA